MAKYRDYLPQIDGDFFLTRGGLETTSVLQGNVDVSHCAAIELMKTDKGRARLRAYYAPYIDIARDAGAGFILEAPTWRANTDWGQRLGYTAASLSAANRAAIEMLHGMRIAQEDRLAIVVSGSIGPRREGCTEADEMHPREAARYHKPQTEAFADADADLITATNMTNMNEAIGTIIAAKIEGILAVISFSVAKDGHLPTGQNLWDAIAVVDIATNKAAAYYMIDCAHMSRLDTILARGGVLRGRLRGLRAIGLARIGEYKDILNRYPSINILDGDGGMNRRQREEFSKAGQAAFRSAA
ncbi:MAG: homocysteine S-methyltransferase family protein [Pseudomonadota bacterium]|nr:homocysteine S-methyltransferase family protein [Pseudomonadota bacterium]